MNFTTYLAQFDTILGAETNEAPYDDPHFLNYTKLNASRMHRWLKKGELTEATKQAIEAITHPQKWILISEPWCGDAAHIVPFIAMMADLNPNIELDIELRDTAPFRIDNYLTNGGKAIPILIVQDASGKDLFHWGPRPSAAQTYFLAMKNEGVAVEESKIKLQQWYNDDHGVQVQEELTKLLAKTQN